MTHPVDPHGGQDPMNRLSGALERLRDSLVQGSLALKDLQYELDTRGRQAAAVELERLLRRIGSR